MFRVFVRNRFSHVHLPYQQKETKPHRKKTKSRSKKKKKHSVTPKTTSKPVEDVKKDVETPISPLPTKPRATDVINARRSSSSISVWSSQSFSTVSASSPDPNSPKNRILDLSEMIPEVTLNLKKERRSDNRKRTTLRRRSVPKVAENSEKAALDRLIQEKKAKIEEMRNRNNEKMRNIITNTRTNQVVPPVNIDLSFLDA